MASDTVTFEHIQSAAERIAGAVRKTACEYSRTLSERTGAQIWVKYENQQFTNSFKERGALNKLLQLNEDERRRGVIAMSAGNHAQGVAYHAQRLGIPATIIMPEDTPTVKTQKTLRFGARVVLQGETVSEAGEYARQMAAGEGLVFVHPFDDADIIAGQGTCAMEMMEQAPGLDMLVVPVGGGGLISGCAIAAKTLWPSIEVIGVESAMYPSLYANFVGGEARAGGATIAEGIAVKRVGELPLTICQALVDEVLLVEESHLEQAIAMFCNIEKTVAEGAGAAGLAAILAEPERFRGKQVGVVLCGGNIDPRLLASVLMRQLVRDGRLSHMRVTAPDRPGTLEQIARIIAKARGNIIEVAHNRLALDVPAKGAEFDFQIETVDADHTKAVIQALDDAGFRIRTLTTL